MEKGEKLLLKSNFSSYPQYFYLLLSFYVRTGTRISLRDKRLFEITEVEIARVDCIYILGVFAEKSYSKPMERNVVYIAITTTSHATSMASK